MHARVWRGASWLQQAAENCLRCPAVVVAEHTPWTWLLLLLTELGCGCCREEAGLRVICNRCLQKQHNTRQGEEHACTLVKKHTGQKRNEKSWLVSLLSRCASHPKTWPHKDRVPLDAGNMYCEHRNTLESAKCGSQQQQRGGHNSSRSRSSHSKGCAKQLVVLQPLDHHSAETTT